MKNMVFKIYGLMVLLISSVSLYGSDVIAEIEYFYSDDGTLIGKAFNGKHVNFEYDLRGQLLAVTDTEGKDLERYTYDPAGNRLSKTINGVTTTYSYDEANQLVTSTVNGVTIHYKYDGAGRMIQAGDKSYIYNGNNKVIEVRQNGKTIAKFEYNIDGQIAKAIYGEKKEEFFWDGLALIWRSGVTYINEPYVTGGNPVMAGDDVLFNDMLGNTLAVNDKAVEMTSFGETDNENAFFTGKPMIEELGYSFLFRDYNPNQGKWTTSDPLGYPDGWNQLAYCGNGVNYSVDLNGLWTVQIGITFFGGGASGGMIGFGIAIGYSKDSGFTAGFYQTTGGGSEIGAGGSITGSITISGAGAISALEGTAITIGGSGGEGIVIGGEANIPTDISQIENSSGTFSIGVGIGTPAEMHTFITYTFIQQIIGCGGCVNSIKE